ncbi:DMT family transporter [Tepidibacillus sp. HK-1]|uniref:DMT family transporter n=1 Tax=Tepidibacillus sp. HK-1 TaxID=1883407 RepID=UPI000852E73E|nr:DMT family transporter [Tepidibacillus sp. HK-1]GBF11212.1 putative DMT superfamily transporter inner membrane protein [Tepidibacillus sp. HK-1]
MPIIALFVLSLLWGSTFFLTKLLLIDFEPVSIVFYRCLFGMLGLLPFFLWKKKKEDFIRLPILIMITLISAGIPWVFMSFSLQGLDTTVSGVLNASGPVIGTILSIVIFKKIIPRHEIWSVLIGFTGIFITILAGMNGNGQFHVGSAALLLFAVCFYSMSAVFSSMYLKHCSVFTLSFTTMAVGTIYSGVFMLFIEPMSFRNFVDWKPFLLFLAIGMVSSGFGNMIYYYLVKSGGALFALLVTYLMPIMTILLGVLFLGENVSIGMVVGLFFVLTSVYLMNKKKVYKKGVIKEYVS